MSCCNHGETVNHLLCWCKKLVGTEYGKRYSSPLKVFPVNLAVEH